MDFVSPVRRTGFIGSTLRVSSPFGMRKNPVTGKRLLHNGIDIAIPQGTPLFAAAPGIVEDSDPTCSRSGPNGGFVILRHADGSRSAYVHMSRVAVRNGQQVERWTQLGKSGGRKGDRCSGRSTGPHLHFIIRPNGKTAVNPIPLVNWYPFTLTYKGRRIPATSRQWGGSVTQLRQLPWWVFALGGLAATVLVLGVGRRVAPRRQIRQVYV
jgi:murein DD-endopeptidase MepM/ murein hydrolase activator NlpD